ncbi:hypothetical protein ACN42_g6648 [Penicillium freii]|uniref:Uncharacterized protein n=1 Tax=Penicillium freii TaxID=48697 RepID=A0A101MH25_PENFR|nr:hypothetical protein ACN42_g6648 [Penicillium freii]
MNMQKRKSLPRGIEPRSPALIGFNDKRKSSPLDQGRCDGRVTARPLGWLMKELVCLSTSHGVYSYLHFILHLPLFLLPKPPT